MVNFPRSLLLPFAADDTSSSEEVHHPPSWPAAPVASGTSLTLVSVAELFVLLQDGPPPGARTSLYAFPVANR